MEVGFVGIAAATAIALNHPARSARAASLLASAAAVLVLVEAWPMPWPTIALPKTAC